jgi:uncharacterized Zn finger protein
MPAIHLEDVLLAATDGRIHERGRELLGANAVVRGTRAGNVLRARVAGSSAHPYRVTINLDVGEWTCTCPYEFGAVCKHVFAVTLAALETPEVFVDAPASQNPALEATLKAIATLNDDEVWTLLEALERSKPEIIDEYAFNIAQRDAGW